MQLSSSQRIGPRRDEQRVDARSINKALVSGAALPLSLRAELEARGVKTRQAFATAELGIIAYSVGLAGK